MFTLLMPDKLIHRADGNNFGLSIIFIKQKKSYWILSEALNKVDKDMKVIMLLFFEDMIPCKEVAKANSAKGQKKVFGKLFLIPFSLWYMDLSNIHSLFPFPFHISIIKFPFQRPILYERTGFFCFFRLIQKVDQKQMCLDQRICPQ